jgi:hypothetical protein
MPFILSHVKHARPRHGEYRREEANHKQACTRFFDAEIEKLRREPSDARKIPSRIEVEQLPVQRAQERWNIAEGNSNGSRHQTQPPSLLKRYVTGLGSHD